MKRIIITGSNGFVGANLIPVLSEKYEIITLGRSNCDFNWEQLAYLPKNVDSFIHLAGLAHDVSNTSNAQDYMKVNTELTKKVYDFFTCTQAKYFIYFSSVKAAADEVKSDWLTENQNANPKTAYGISKLKAEEYLLSNLFESKKTIVLRPCMIHGPGNKGNLNLLHSVIKKGIPYPLGAFENKRSLLSIDNLSFIILQILECRSLTSGVYNIADDKPLATQEIIEIMGTVMQKKIIILNLPQWLVLFFAKLGGNLKLPFNQTVLKKLTENYQVANGKIKEALNINALPLTAEAGLEKTISSFNKAG
jgi:nucleoside-diphosphate-sugar epimerase